MTLPTKTTPPRTTLSDFTVLIYGQSKIGKSTLCSHAPGALFLATEAGLNTLDVYQLPISTWAEMLSACGEIAKGGHQFKSIVIDTIDNAYRMCVEHICAKYKIDHESDLAFGKAYAAINSEFHRVLNRLSLLPYGLYLISHAKSKEIETRTGKMQRTFPSLPEKACGIVLGMVDIILYCDWEAIQSDTGGCRRVMRSKPTAHYEAGDRTGRLPDSIEMSYDAFERAFALAAKPADKPVPQPTKEKK